MKINWIKFLITTLTCLFFIGGVIIISGNYLLLGGEGNYFTDFELTKNVGSFAWVPINAGTGYPNLTLNGLTIIFDFFSLLQHLGASLKAINLIIVYLVYILPFLSMLWLLHKTMKAPFLPSYLISLFYILNPFSTYHLQGVMFWNTTPFFVLPLAFGVLYEYYHEKLKLFFVFGLLTSIMAFSFSNIPYLGIFHIFLVITLIIIPYIKHVRFNLITFLGNFLITESSFFLFNAWWLINLVRFANMDLGDYTKEFAIGIAKVASGTGGAIFKIFSFTTLVTLEKGSYFSDFYNGFPVNIILFIPFFLIIWNLFNSADRKKTQNAKESFVVAAFILLVVFLNKGVNQPFKGIYLWMLDNIPYFIIFKSPLEKFSVLLIFLFAIALIQVFKNAKSRLPYYLLAVYLIFCSIPYLTLNFMPEIAFERGKYISRKYLNKESYQQAKHFLNHHKLDYRVLGLPGSKNYQVTMLNHDGNKYYRGLDPFVYSVNKPFINAYTAPESNLDHLFSNISDPDTEESLLNIYNIKQIVINKDIYPAFGFREKESVKKLINIFSKKNDKQVFDSITIFNRQDFLPHFYIPKKNIISVGSGRNLARIVSDNSRHPSFAMFFSKQNTDRQLDRLLKGVAVGDETVEFKKINPTKYRVVVHGAKKIFPLVFSESFHSAWKLYLNIKPPLTIKSHDLSSYKILDGNSADQATKEELGEFINQVLITSLGNGEQIDFISKNFQGTIQNDNLAPGPFYETWLRKPVDEKDHFVANGYANSWILDTDKICGGMGNTTCIKNPDNATYDFEVIVEFWPQRLYYLGLSISFLTALISIICLMFSSLRERKKESLKL